MDGITVNRRTYRIDGGPERTSIEVRTAGERPMFLGRIYSHCECGEPGLHADAFLGHYAHRPDELTAIGYLIESAANPYPSLVDSHERYLVGQPQDWPFREIWANAIAYARATQAA